MSKLFFLCLMLLGVLPVYASNDSCLASLKPNTHLSQELINSLTPLGAAFLKDNGQALFFSEDSPTIGSQKGGVTVIDFFDYQCSYCKRFSPLFVALATTQPQLRVVFKELPIFGQESEAASLAALAAYKQGKYVPLHEKLMALVNLDQSHIASLSQEAGVTPTLLSNYEKQSNQELVRNFGLSDKLHLIGTPSFVIASINPVQLKEKKYEAIHAYYIAGAIDVPEMRALVKEFSEKC